MLEKPLSHHFPHFPFIMLHCCIYIWLQIKHIAAFKEQRSLNGSLPLSFKPSLSSELVKGNPYIQVCFLTLSTQQTCFHVYVCLNLTAIAYITLKPPSKLSKTKENSFHLHFVYSNYRLDAENPIKVEHTVPEIVISVMLKTIKYKKN